MGEAQATLEAPLRALQQAEIAFSRGYSADSSLHELEYSFKHVTMREVAYNTLVRKRREELHLQTARAIAALYPSDEYVETIAYHYSRTDVGVEAAEWLEGQEIELLPSTPTMPPRHTTKTRSRLVDSRTIRTPPVCARSWATYCSFSPVTIKRWPPSRRRGTKSR